MKKAIKRLFSELSSFSTQQLNRAHDLLSGVGSDLAALKKLSEAKAYKLVDSICDDRRIYDGVHGFLKAAKESHESAILWLRQNWDVIQEYLDEKVQEKPKVVGFIDGGINIFLAVPATRRSRSAAYKEYVNYGRAVGAILSVTVFLPGFTVRGLLGLVPYATRIVKYFKEKSLKVQLRDDEPRTKKSAKRHVKTAMKKEKRRS